MPRIDAWTLEIINDLRELYTTTDMTHTAIAEELNKKHSRNFSRNAIIGKVNRLGINTQRSTEVKSNNLAKRRRGKKIVVHAQFQERKTHPVPRVPAPKKERNGAHAEASLPVDICELADDVTCRWPLGNTDDHPPYMYCGAVPEKGSPYCSTHSAIAFALPKEKGRVYHPRFGQSRRR